MVSGPEMHASPEATARLKRAQFIDRAARRLIAMGGVGVLVAVLAIFVFVGAEAAPLLGGTRVDETARLPARSRVAALRCDEYRRLVYALDDAGVLRVLEPASGAVRREVRVVGPEDGHVVAAATAGSAELATTFVALTDKGRVCCALVTPRVTYGKDGERAIEADVQVEPALDAPGVEKMTRLAIRTVEAMSGTGAVCVAAGPDAACLLRFTIGGDTARVAPLQGVALGGAAAPSSVALAVPGDSYRLYVGLADGRVVRWDASWPEDPALNESIKVSAVPVTALCVLLGDETLLTGTADGSVEAWFGVRASPKAAAWNVTRIRSFAKTGAAVREIAPSPRGKTFAVLDADGNGYLSYLTTGVTLAPLPGGQPATSAVFAPKGDALLVAGEDGGIRELQVKSPHPETSLRSLFLPVWYESAPAPALKWQSTGPDEFEPKMSLTVLVVGTLKGVLYALLFSVPVAFAAAIYTALFLPARLRALIKPAIEVLAAVPSVVIGLLAALWLSPWVEKHLPAVFAWVPSAVVVFATIFTAWRFVPRAARQRLAGGAGALGVVLPAIAVSTLLAVWLGPAVEASVLGGDLKAWFRTHLDMTYDPRNAMVVGFAMGFAVIPVVFTIAEDAISNVPRGLWAASEALGATRWQTTWCVVVPAATPGLFAALMLGFGRAVGETMIVLMATGNTPILDMSPFNGMRTISACIAVEIPEAPHASTLYRVLFLAGLLLFTFTFVCNTAAEVIGQRLRRKYGRE
jgi:phosphate transport system permease protein